MHGNKNVKMKSFTALPEGVVAASSQRHPNRVGDSLVNFSANDAMTPLRPHSGSIEISQIPQVRGRDLGLMAAIPPG